MASLLAELHGNRTLLLIVVSLALFVDFMLTVTMSIVPIAPNYLLHLWHENFTASTTAALLALENGTSVNESSVKEAVEQRRQVLLNEENIYVSVMFASKSLVQILANPFVGVLCDRIGCSLPMFSGFIVSFLSTVLFAFSKSYTSLFIARAIQGLGSACLRTPGLALVSGAYLDDEERGVATGRALGGLALGCLLGPVHGGILYDLQGIELPYLILAGLTMIDGLLQLVVVPPKVQRPAPDGRPATEMTQLLRDPHIWIVTGSIVISNAGIALMQTSMMIYMIQRWDSSPTVQGLIDFPSMLLYLIATQLFGKLATQLGRWLITMIGHFFFGLSMIVIPFLPTPAWIAVPMAVLGTSIGMCDVANYAELPNIVDLRHTPNAYGSVSALGNIAISVVFVSGPLIGGPLISASSFKRIILGMGCIILLYGPMLFFNRSIVRSQDEEVESLLSRAQNEKFKMRQQKETTIPS